MEMAWRLFIKPKSLVCLTSLFIFMLNIKLGEAQLQIEKESSDFDGRKNEFSSLYCRVVGPGDKTYEWYHNGNLITSQYSLPGFYSINSDTLTINQREVTQRHQGIYQLFVSSAFGRIFCRKMEVKFKVIGEFDGSVSTLPDIRQVVEGQPLHLRCPKHSYMRGCVYKWGGNSLTGGMKFINENRNRVVLPDGTLYFSALTKIDLIEFGWKDGGCKCILDCVFPNFHKMASSHKVCLNRTAVNASNFGPKIVTVIKDREIISGSKYVHVICAAAGSPTPSYRWAKINKDGNMVDIKESKNIEFGNFNQTMTIYNIDVNHNGTYACIATIGFKHDIVKWKLIVKEKPIWLSMIVNNVVDVFTNFTWECKARGDPIPTYAWYSNASRMDTKSKRYEIDNGRLSFSRVLLEDTGMYQCTVGNGFGGYIYQTVSLHVRAQRPEFNESIINVAFLKGSRGTLRCQSSAIPSANHTWTKNGIPLNLGIKDDFSGGKILVINQMRKEDAGIYKCFAENVFGKAEQVINVTIEDIRFVRKPATNYNVTKSTSFSLYCKVEASRQVQYKWRFNGRDLKIDDNHIWSESVNRLLIQNVKESDSGKYDCVAYIIKPSLVERSVTANVLVTGPPNALEGFHLKGHCKNSTAILRWRNLPIYNNSDTVVIVEWRTTYDPEHRWYKATNKVNAALGEAKVTKLSPWTKVQFRAITQNSYGNGPACEPTKFENCETAPSRPAKCPEDILVINVQPGVLDIQWKALSTIDFNGPGFNYVVQYKRPNAPFWNKAFVDTTAEQFTIPNAGTNQLWYFKLQTNNSEGLGPMCLDNSSYSGQSKPGFISELVIKEVGTSSVLITWSPPISDLWDIDGYMLEYGETGVITSRKKRSSCDDISSNPCSRILLTGELIKECKLTNLSAMTRYNISLKAYNIQGNGPPKYSTFQTASVIFGEKKSGSPLYKRNWFITVISIIVLLMFIVLFIVFVLNTRRSDRYLVGKREKKKGGFYNLYNNRHDHEPTIYPSENNRESSKPSMHVSNESTIAADDEVSFALSTEDKYDDDGSFVGEYSDVTSAKKYEEIFV